MKRSLLLGAVLACLFSAPKLHAQLVGGDPMNDYVCSAEYSQCGGGTTGSSGGSGGSYTTICRSGSSPSTYCFIYTYDAQGRPTNACIRAYSSTGWCTCSSGRMAGSCSIDYR